jgi:hypothetical protein
LAVPYSENGPLWDIFYNYGGHQLEYNSEDFKRNILLVLPTAGMMEQVDV